MLKEGLQPPPNVSQSVNVLLFFSVLQKMKMEMMMRRRRMRKRKKRRRTRRKRRRSML